MALVTNNAEGGSNGTTVTTGNSGGASGTAFAAVNSGITFSTTQKAHGSLAYAFAGTGATFNTVQLNSGDGTTTGFSVRAYVYLTGAPSAETSFITVQTGAGGSICALNLTTGGNIKVVQSGGTAISGGTFTNALTLNTWHRITIWGTLNATTGTINCSFYPADSGSATETHNFTNVNTGATAGGRVLYGKLTQAPSMATYYIDDIAQDMTIATEIPAVSNTPPTVDAGANQNVAASATVNLSASASDPDGSIASYAWTFDYASSGPPSLTGGTTATPSFTAGAAGNLYVLRCTVTDNSSATSSDTVEVRVPISGSATAVTLAANGTGDPWVLNGSATTDGAALADSDTTTYLETGSLTSTPTERKVRLQPMSAKSALDIDFTGKLSASGSGTLALRLYEGTTLRQETTVSASTSSTAHRLTASGGTISSITDWGNLWVAVAATS